MFSQAFTYLHKAILDRMNTAEMGRFTIKQENRPMGTSTLRPDLILARGEEAIILDVTVLFENRRAALLEGRRRPTSTNRSGTTSSSGTSG